MTEKEMVEMLYKQYNKMVINLKEACEYRLFGMSYSKASKLFSGKDQLPDSVILENGILPKWEKKGSGVRQWKLTDIAKWLIEAEENKNAK